MTSALKNGSGDCTHVKDEGAHSTVGDEGTHSTVGGEGAHSTVGDEGVHVQECHDMNYATPVLAELLTAAKIGERLFN